MCTINPINLYYKYKINNIKQNNIITEDVLNTEIYNLYINSSHNSYISGIQNFNLNRFDTFIDVLNNGARAIELDIHENNGDIYVCHGDMILIPYLNIPKHVITTNKLNIEQYFIYLNEFLNKNNTFIILFLEINIQNETLRTKLNNIIKKNLNTKIIKDENFIFSKLKDLLNKIAIVTTSPNRKQLDDIITTHIYSTNNILSNDNNYTSINKENKLSRIYPSSNIYHSFSFNYDPIPFFSKFNNCVCLNFNKYDKYLLKNQQFFNGQSFKIIQKT